MGTFSDGKCRFKILLLSLISAVLLPNIWGSSEGFLRQRFPKAYFFVGGGGGGGGSQEPITRNVQLLQCV